jgi:hypothetical protein
MVRVGSEHEWLAGDDAGANRWRQRLAGDTDEGGVGVAADQGLAEPLVVLLGEDDLDRGMRAMEVAEHSEETPVDGSPDNPDLEGAAQQPAQGGDRVAAVLDRGDCGAGVGDELLAGIRQPDSPRVAVKEGLAELGLEAPDLVADGRLSDRDADRRAGELLLLSDRDEIGELPHVHNGSL